jgi:MFS family permease
LDQPEEKRPTITPSRSDRLRITTSLFVAQATFAAATGASFTLLTVSAIELTGSAVYAGFPAAALLLGRALAAYPIGRLMDAAGRRPALALGYLLGVIGALAGAISTVGGSFPGLVAASLVFGMSRASSDQARFVATEVHPVERRGFIIGVIVFAGTAGAIAVPGVVAMSTSMAESTGLDTFAGPWLAAAVLIAAAYLITVGFVRPDPRDVVMATSGLSATEIDTLEVRESSPRPLREIFAGNNVQLAVFAMVVGQAVMVLVMTIAPAHMHNHGYLPTTISVGLSVHTVGMFGLSAITGRLVDQYGQKSVMAVGTVLLMGASVMTPFTDNFAIMLAMMFLLGYGWNLCFVAGSSLLLDGLAPHERGRTQGAGDGIAALAAAIGGIATGPIFGAGGMGWIGAAGLATSVVLALVLARHGLSDRPGTAAL